MDKLRYWWRIFRDAGILWIECNAFSYAGSLAFYTLFSLAPTIIIAVTVASLVMGEASAQSRVVEEFQAFMGDDAASLVEEAVANSQVESGGILPTVAGIAALMVGATTVFAQMQHLEGQTQTVPKHIADFYQETLFLADAGAGTGFHSAGVIDAGCRVAGHT